MSNTTSSSAPGAGPSTAPARRPRIKWHHVYFLLAAFDVFTVSLSLFLNHQLVETNKATVHGNLQWVTWITQCDVLAKQAGQVNAPGNDVLNSRDVPAESSRFNAAVAGFQQTLSALHGELLRNVPPHSAVVLLNDCSFVGQQLDELVAQIDTVFSLTRDGRLDQIQPRMARISHEYEDVLRGLDQLRLDLRNQRQTYLEGQVTEASRLQRYEWLLGLLIVVMVVGIVVYGVRLDRHVSGSETNIREAQERYRLLVEQSMDGILVADADWNIRFANEAACRMFGYRYGELLRRNVADTYLPEDLDQAARRKRDIRIGDSAHYERAVLRKDGSRFLADVRVRRLEHGGYQGVFRDITERKRDEEARVRLAEIVESSHDAIIGTNLDGIITDWNVAAERLYGYTADEIMGQSIARIIPEDRHHEKNQTLRRVSAGEAISNFESFNITKGGCRIPVSLTVSPIKDAAGNILGTSAIIRDITERKRAEDQLLLQSAALEAAANGIVITDSHGIVLWVNPAFTSLTGYSAEEVIGKTPSALKSGKHDGSFYRELWETVIAGRVWQGEIINRRKDGTLYTEDMTITPVRDGNGKISRFVAIKQDITHRKEAEESLRQSNRRLEHALEDLQNAQQQVVQQERLRALGTMASGLAHDFNNALAGILGFTELLLYRPGILDDKTKIKEYLEMMNTAAKDASHVVNRLREFYRSRDQGEVFAPVNLNRLVEEAISLTQPKWKTQAEARGIIIRAETDLQEIPPVAGNAADLREALTNLIFNAVDAMPRGGVITIRTRGHDSRVILEVADTGSGMTEEVRSRCLEPFFTTKGDGGTGLGLSMVYGIIQRHEGDVDIRTQLDKGTTIILSLPAHRQLQAVVKNDVAAVTPLVSKRVLLVDDEEIVRTVVNEYLVHDGHSVELAANGNEGLTKFRNGLFDLVILDRAMPDMSGDQVGTAIKQSFPNMPVIMLTGFGSMMEAAGEKPDGVDFVVSKPVTIDTLRRAVASAVGND